MFVVAAEVSKDFEGNLDLKVIIGGVNDSKEFVPNQCLKIWASFGKFDNHVLRSGIYWTDGRLQKKAMALYLERSYVSSDSMTAPALHIFRASDVPVTICHCATSLARRSSTRPATVTPWSKTREGEWQYEGIPIWRFSRDVRGQAGLLFRMCFWFGLVVVIVAVVVIIVLLLPLLLSLMLLLLLLLQLRLAVGLPLLLPLLRLL